MPKRQPTLPKRQPIVVSGKFMPSAELARMLGISPRRAKELDRLLEEHHRKDALRLAKERAPRKGQNGRSRASAR
jgi:hypothetical protein